MSTDSVESHAKFCKSLELPFPLLADVDGKVSTRYKIARVRGKKILSGRSVFLIDAGGKVIYADSNYTLKPAADHDALLSAVKKLGAAGKETSADLKLEGLKFGQLTVNGRRYRKDVIISSDGIGTRDKGPSRHLKPKYGHTPLTIEEAIPWDCKKLIIGTGIHGRLPILDEIKKEAKKRGVELKLMKTEDAVKYLRENYDADTHAILHLTC